jgi:hypothetical protein
VIVRRNLKHHLGTAYSEEHIRATGIVLEDQMGEITVTAVYSPPKHNIKTIEYKQFFQTLGHRFIAGGDDDAKTCIGAPEQLQPKGENSTTLCGNITYNICHPVNTHTGRAT